MEALKNKRAGHRGRATSLIARIEQETSQPVFSTDNVEMMIGELERQRELVCGLDAQILNKTEANDVDQEICEASEKLMKIDFIIRKTNKLLQTNAATSHPPHESTAKNVKLPLLTLAKFSGDLLDWLKFWDLYRSAVHERNDLPAPVKFQYLIGQLEGEAAQLLSGFNHSEAEYAEAINLLKETYGQTHQLVQARLNALFDISPPKATVESLSNFRSTYEGHLRVLKSLECDTEHSGYVFAHLLLRKLPMRTRDNLNRARGTNIWTLDNLRSSINEELQHLTAIQHDPPSYDEGGDKVSYSASFPITTRNNLCKFCSTSHASYLCTKYNNAQARKERAIELNLCLNCLKPNHAAFSCLNKNRCRTCHKKHHTSLCFKSNSDSPANKSDKKLHASEVGQTSRVNVITETPDISLVNVASASSNSKVSQKITTLLPTANAILKGKKLKIECKVLLDDAAQGTFILNSLAKQLDLETLGCTTLEVDGFGSTGEAICYNIVEVPVCTSDGTIYIKALAVENMTTRLSMPGRGKFVSSLSNSDLNLADNGIKDTMGSIHLIIGGDSYHKFVPGNRVKDNVFSIDSNLGKILIGTIPNPDCSNNATVSTVLRIGVNETEESLTKNIENLWNFDAIGIKNFSENDLAIEKFNKSVIFKDGKYSTNLPWRDGCTELPSNKSLAFVRMRSVINSLSKEKPKLNLYNEIISEQLKSNFIELVPDDYVEPDGVHYIPHHCVTKDSDTTPIRIVFDCSAKQDSSKPSLNDCLLTGPSMVNDIISLLLNFKLKNFACVADIEKAFLMVGINPCDRDYVRFFWPQDPFNPKSKVLTYRFKVVLFGSTASQFLLNSTILHHLGLYPHETADILRQSIYIDNVVANFQSEDELFNFYKISKCIMNEGGFNLREWLSNSKSFNDSLDGSDKCAKTIIKVLGVNWDSGTDQFSIKPYVPSPTSSITKRQIVSDLSKTYDPFGVLMPLTVSGKIFLQDVWKCNISWDENLPSHLLESWNSLISNFAGVCVNMQRKFLTYRNPELHIFADASSRCYGAVAYLFEGDSADFIIAKSRLAPIKAPTLPQLELTAVNIAAKLSKFIISNLSFLNIKVVYIWTDSEITLHWLYSKNAHKKPYVRQRVDDIKELCPTAVFVHIAGSDNPADLLTRGVSAKIFLNNLSLWLNGPIYKCKTVDPTTNEKFFSCSVNCVETQIIDVPSIKNPTLIKIENYSSYNKLLRVAAYVFKFICILKARTRNLPLPCLKLSTEDLICAELYLIKIDQSIFYREVIDFLNKKTGQMPSIVYQLNLKIENGILRSFGRIHNSNLSESSKFPILLSPDSFLTKLIILSLHKRSLHSGTNYVLSMLRESWWLPRGRQVIKKVLKKCVTCAKVQAKSYGSPSEPPLPAARVTDSLPFQITGCDYTGAIDIRNGENLCKAYLVLFTCATTRAVHLEVAYNLSADEFLRVFIKFSSRRSMPQIILSDNATNFVSAAETLSYIAESSVVTNFMLDNRCKWQFITPRAPWHGGMWERLIGLTKTAFKKTIGKALLNRDDLETVVVQVECAINDRPITYLSDDLRDFQPLTPSLLLHGFKLREFPTMVDQSIVLDPNYGTRDRLTKSFLKRLKVAHLLIQRWRQEYLLNLRERYSSKNLEVPINVGNVVLIYDECPRVNWKLGMVTKVFPGSDHKVRSVELKTANGSVSRPVTKLYPLEVCATEEPLSNENELRTMYPRVSKTVALNRISSESMS